MGHPFLNICRQIASDFSDRAASILVADRAVVARRRPPPAHDLP
jgi:hypothetical protein